MIISRLRKYFTTALLAFGLAGAAPVVFAQNSIEAFDVTQQGGQVLVRLTMKQALTAAPASFTVASPARIAFDFPSTANNLGRTSQEIGERDLRSMNLVQVGDRTRMVLNLRNMVQYESRVDGKTLLISLAAPAAAPVAGAARFQRHGEHRLQHAPLRLAIRKTRCSVSERGREVRHTA